jgi:enoyl-CoA hydratase/carnithine racemase
MTALGVVCDQMLVTGERIGAQEALRLGLIDHLVETLDEV